MGVMVMAVVDAAIRYTKAYDAENWPESMKAITELRHAVKALYGKKWRGTREN